MPMTKRRGKHVSWLFKLKKLKLRRRENETRKN
jgi:hypothetical protein